MRINYDLKTLLQYQLRFVVIDPHLAAEVISIQTSGGGVSNVLRRDYGGEHGVK